MPLEPEILDALRNVNTTLTQLNTSITRMPKDGRSGGGGGSERLTPFSSSLFRGSELAALKLRKQMSSLEQSSKSFAKILKDVTPDVKTLNTLASDMFTEVVNGLNLSELEKVPKRFARMLEESDNAWTKRQAIGMNSLEQVEEFVKRSQRRAENLDEMRELMKLAELGPPTEDLIKRVEELGFDASELSLSFTELRDRSQAAARAVRDGTAATSAAARESVLAIKSFSRALMSFVPGAMLLGKAALTAATSAAKFGTNLDMTTSYWMAMAPEDLAAMQAEYKQSIMAAGGSVDEFNKRILDNQGRLIEYTGDLAIAARVVAGMSDAGMLLTGSVGQLDTFIEQQTTTFGRFNRVFSMTAEQFTEMNKQMLESTNIRGQMLKIDKGLRQAYFVDLQQTYEGLRLKGLEHDAALQMIETLEGMGKKKAIDRFKEAAKLQAVMGAYGMGAEGARAGQLLRGGLRKPEQKEEFMNIMKKANVVLGDKMGQSIAAEMLIQQTIQTAALDEYLGDNSQFVKLATAEGKQITEVAANTQALTRYAGEATDVMNEVMIVQQQLHKAITSDLAGAITALTAAVWAMAGSSVAGMFGKGVRKTVVAGARANAGLLKGGAQLGGALGGVAAAANTYQETGSAWEATKSGVTSGGGAAIGSWVLGALGSAAGPIGTGLGMAAGGILGGILGDVLYDTFLANDPEKEAEETEKREEKHTKTVTKLNKQIESEERKLTELNKQLEKTRKTIEDSAGKDSEAQRQALETQRQLTEQLVKTSSSIGKLKNELGNIKPPEGTTIPPPAQTPVQQMGSMISDTIGGQTKKQQEAFDNIYASMKDFTQNYSFLNRTEKAEKLLIDLKKYGGNLKDVDPEVLAKVTATIESRLKDNEYRLVGEFKDIITSVGDLSQQLINANPTETWIETKRTLESVGQSIVENTRKHQEQTNQLKESDARIKSLENELKVNAQQIEKLRISNDTAIQREIEKKKIQTEIDAAEIWGDTDEVQRLQGELAEASNRIKEHNEFMAQGKSIGKQKEELERKLAEEKERRDSINASLAKMSDVIKTDPTRKDLAERLNKMLTAATLLPKEAQTQIITEAAFVRAQEQKRTTTQADLKTAIDNMNASIISGETEKAATYEKQAVKLRETLDSLNTMLNDTSVNNTAYMEALLKAQEQQISALTNINRTATQQTDEIKKQTEATEKGCKANQRMMYIRAPTRAVTATR